MGTGERSAHREPLGTFSVKRHAAAHRRFVLRLTSDVGRNAASLNAQRLTLDGHCRTLDAGRSSLNAERGMVLLALRQGEGDAGLLEGLAKHRDFFEEIR